MEVSGQSHASAALTRKRALKYPLNRTLVVGFECCGDKKKYLKQSGFELQTTQPVAQSLPHYAIPTPTIRYVAALER